MEHVGDAHVRPGDKPHSSSLNVAVVGHVFNEARPACEPTDELTGVVDREVHGRAVLHALDVRLRELQPLRGGRVEDHSHGFKGGEVVDEVDDPVLLEVVEDSRDDDDGGPLAILLHPLDPRVVEHIARDQDLPLAGREEFASHVDDLGQVEFEPEGTPIVAAPVRRLQPASDADDRRVGVHREKLPYPAVHVDRARDARNHGVLVLPAVHRRRIRRKGGLQADGLGIVDHRRVVP